MNENIEHEKQNMEYKIPLSVLVCMK